ncbi:putative transcriptional regulator [Bradyrhizobium liaoningense]
MSDAGGRNFIELTASIVSAYLSNNPTPAAEIPNLISQVHGALVRVSSGRTEAAPLEPAKPAVSLKKSIAPDYLVCLEDRAGPGCLDSAPLDLSGFLPGYAERGALRFCRCVGRA